MQSAQFIVPMVSFIQGLKLQQDFPLYQLFLFFPRLYLGRQLSHIKLSLLSKVQYQTNLKCNIVMPKLSTRQDLPTQPLRVISAKLINA